MKCLRTCNERQRRQFLASKADSLGYHGVNYVCNVGLNHYQVFTRHLFDIKWCGNWGEFCP